MYRGDQSQVAHGDDEQEFREHARQFLEENAVPLEAFRGLTPHQDDIVLSEARKYQLSLYEAGLAGLTWPVVYGGQGLPTRFQTAFNDEATHYFTPDGMYAIGFGMCIPTILAHGSEAQKERYVRSAIQGVDIWCQLFSEPGAGSDLASVRCSAAKDSDGWLINGQKLWSTGAHRAQHGLLLARTDTMLPKHAGLSMFIVDMASPGITVRPIRQMNGKTNFNEVFLTDVKVTLDDLVGPLDGGWGVALTTLMNERVSIGARSSSESFSPRDSIALHLSLAERRGRTQDPVIRQDLARLITHYWILDMLGLRIRSAQLSGRRPGPQGAVAKLARSLVTAQAAQMASVLAGPRALAWTPDDREGETLAETICGSPGASLAGGTSEILRNLLAERILGLPKDPQIDTRSAFRDLLHN